ncbi:MAG: hypothetical protein JO006_09140 [Paucibacter sp.]|nr:hypothetical protein [Roseateles sp.]
MTQTTGHGDGQSVRDDKRTGVSAGRLDLANALRTEALGNERLSVADREVLLQAAKVLMRMGQAQPAQTAGGAGWRHRRRLISATENNFGALSTVGDRVALIAIVNHAVLRQASYLLATPAHLHSQFSQAFDTLLANLASQCTDDNANQVVANAWDKFLQARPKIVEAYAPLIAHLNRTPPVRGEAVSRLRHEQVGVTSRR